MSQWEHAKVMRWGRCRSSFRIGREMKRLVEQKGAHGARESEPYLCWDSSAQFHEENDQNAVLCLLSSSRPDLECKCRRPLPTMQCEPPLPFYLPQIWGGPDEPWDARRPSPRQGVANERDMPLGGAAAARTPVCTFRSSSFCWSPATGKVC